MKLRDLITEQQNPANLAKWIKDIFDQSEDPDWQHVEAHEWIGELNREFPNLSPSQTKQVAKFIYLWTSSMSTEEPPPPLGEITDWINTELS